MNNNVHAEITPIKEVLNRNLSIPHYQRPYRWGIKNILQLLTDINNSRISGKKQYRIGGMILHEVEQNQYDIVDGQQRLTTLLLVIQYCESNLCEQLLKGLKYSHSDSIQNIIDNNTFIKDWLQNNISDKQGFCEYILERCEFVVIQIANLSEAFQMFDTQNSRGKSLEAYNLLKAYHIRAMEQNSREDKIKCDQRWEGAIQYDATPGITNDPNIDILKQLFEEQIYRSRIWSKNEIAGRFSNQQIDEFKGFTIDKNHTIEFPYQNPQLLQYLTAKFYNTILAGTIGVQSRFEMGDSENIDPFVNINQAIVNGKAFFDYIETYVEIYKRLFIDLGSYQLADFKKFYYQYCLVYNADDNSWNEGKKRISLFRDMCRKSLRDGDGYLREVYKSLCLTLFDKFGEKGLRRYYKALYFLIYTSRVKNYAVKYQTAQKLPIEYFKIISTARNFTDLLELDKAAAKMAAENDNLKSAEDVLKRIRGEE